MSERGVGLSKKCLTEEFFLTSVFWFVFLATAKNEQEVQSKVQMIRDYYSSERTKSVWF